MEGFFGKKSPNWNDSHNASNELAPFFISKKSSLKSGANGPKRYYVHTDDDFGNFCTSIAQSIKKNYLWENEVPLMILGMSNGKGNTVVGMLRSNWESMTTVSIGALYVSCDKDLHKIWDGSLKVSEFTVTLEYDEYWHIGSAPVQTPETVIMLGSSTYEITGNKTAAESEMPMADSFEPAQEVSTDLIVDTFMIGGMILATAIISNREKKRQAAAAAKKAEENAKKMRDEAARQREMRRQMMKSYGISEAELKLPDDFDDTPENIYKHMLADATKWFRKIQNSQPFKQAVKKLVDDYNALPAETRHDYNSVDDGKNWPGWAFGEAAHRPGFKPTYSFFNGAFKPSEGVNGWEESMEYSDWEQDQITSFLAAWAYDVAELLEQKYGIGIDLGDGDEGHFYYNLR